MEQNKIDIFIGTMSDKFNPMDVPQISARLAKLDDDKLIAVQALEYKNPIVLLIVSLFFGFLGIDRFLLGNILLGILKLITLGGFGIWTIIDWFLIMGATKKANFAQFNNQMNMMGV